MQRNSKLSIMVVLMIAAILVWVRKDGKIPNVSSAGTSVAFDQAIAAAGAVPRRRTEFVDWGRNPFAFPQEEETAGVSDLTILCIIWNDENAAAFINDSVVRVGDKIADKTVKQIEQNRVILTDGTKDYVLGIQE